MLSLRHNIRSTKTRIETKIGLHLRLLVDMSQYKIHQNKDWNSTSWIALHLENMRHNIRSTKTRIETEFRCFLYHRFYLSQYKIHQNKDWNIHFVTSMQNFKHLSQYKIHQNKDWNHLIADTLTPQGVVTI